MKLVIYFSLFSLLLALCLIPTISSVQHRTGVARPNHRNNTWNLNHRPNGNHSMYNNRGPNHDGNPSMHNNGRPGHNRNSSWLNNRRPNHDGNHAMHNNRRPNHGGNHSMHNNLDPVATIHGILMGDRTPGTMDDPITQSTTHRIRTIPMGII
jgi:hypothetical protein